MDKINVYKGISKHAWRLFLIELFSGYNMDLTQNYFSKLLLEIIKIAADDCCTFCEQETDTIQNDFVVIVDIIKSYNCWMI